MEGVSRKDGGGDVKMLEVTKKREEANSRTGFQMRRQIRMELSVLESVHGKEENTVTTCEVDGWRCGTLVHNE